MPDHLITNQLLYYIDVVGVWSVNPYRHCSHRCCYCIAGSQGESTPWFTPDKDLSLA
ncbi:MAG: hypothetical protein ACYDBB_20105 [Armatimonadota bacterium]